MKLRDLLFRSEPVTAAATAEPVTGAATAAAFDADAGPGGLSRHGNGSQGGNPQAEARSFYHPGDCAVDVVQVFVDQVSRLAAQYTLMAETRDVGGAWVPIDTDDRYAQLAGLWRDTDSDSQSTLVQDIARELLLVGELLHYTTVADGRDVSARVVQTDMIHPRSKTVRDGRQHTLVQLRSNAGPAPLPGVDVPGRWIWLPDEFGRRVWTRGPRPADASSPVMRSAAHARAVQVLLRDFAQRGAANLGMDRILLLAHDTNSATDPARHGAPDQFIAQYWATADATTHDHGLQASRKPLPGRVSDPGQAQIIDLRDTITSAEIEQLADARETLARSLPGPQHAYLNGQGGAQRMLNNDQLTAAIHEEAVQPVLTEICAAGTRVFFRPLIDAATEAGQLSGGIRPSDVRLGWRPVRATLAGASPETVMKAHREGLLSYAEATSLLGSTGWTIDERGGVTDYAHWWAAARANAAHHETIRDDIGAAPAPNELTAAS